MSTILAAAVVVLVVVMLVELQNYQCLNKIRNGILFSLQIYFYFSLVSEFNHFEMVNRMQLCADSKLR